MNSGSSRCRRQRLPAGCAHCRCSRRSASTSCSGLRARPGRCVISRARCWSRKAPFPKPSTCSSTDACVESGTTARPGAIERARGDSASSGAAGRADAKDGPHDRQCRDARLDGRRVEHAARRQHGPRARAVHDPGRARRPGISRNLQPTGRGVGVDASSPPTDCCPSRRSSRCSGFRFSRGSRPTKWPRSPGSPKRWP